MAWKNTKKHCRTNKQKLWNITYLKRNFLDVLWKLQYRQWDPDCGRHWISQSVRIVEAKKINTIGARKEEEKKCYLSHGTFRLSATRTITIDCPLLTCAVCRAGFFLHILKQPKWVLDCNFSNTLTVHSPCCSGRGWRGQGRQTDIATCSLNNISILKNAFYMHGTCSCQNIIEDILESFSSSFYNFSTAKDFSNRSYKVFLLTLAMGLTS